MKKFIISLFAFIYLVPEVFPQIKKIPYPIIFVHGLKSSDRTFKTTMEFLNEHYQLGPINVFDVVLNADNDDHTAVLEEDVKYEDFHFGDRDINVGRRNYADDIDDFVDGWQPSYIFAVNFQEERIRGAAGFWNDYFDYSDQAAIFKQGYALSKVIKEVLDFTGAEKVILVGHSMGGLAIREYLQRTEANHIHTNWIDPYSEDGHKVAKVITLGTPHLGSNTGLDPTKSSVLNEKTEAVRDMKWEYDSYTNCNGSPVGIYLFGGNENCIAPTDDNETFYNVDINCNGSTTDNIIGIDFSTYDNPVMPLPEDLPYTWITSIYASSGDLTGDGAVAIGRQWLYVGNEPAPLGITDTLMTDVFHTSEPDDFYTVIRGLDEPSNLDFAYFISLDTQYLGFTTYQTNMEIFDADAYFFRCDPNSQYIISIANEESFAHRIEIYNSNKQLIKEDNFYTPPYQTEITTGEDSVIYLKIYGHATPVSYLYPYDISVTKEMQYIETTFSTDLKAYYSEGLLHLSKPVSGSFELYTLSGQKVFSAIKTQPTENINVKLPAGIYTLSVNNKEKRYITKIAVVK